tara:strand:- start:799 stop:2037 length:1239 start_codon:yes stop_codon:yes gene_type:complete
MERSLNYVSNLTILLPLALVTGPFFSDLIVTLGALYFLIYCLKNNELKYFNNYFFKIFFLFWVYIVVTSFFSEKILISLKVTLPYIRFGLFVSLIFFLVKNKENYLEKFAITTIIVYCIVLLDSYFQFIFGFNILGFVSPQENRLTSFFGDEMVVGSFLSRLFPFVLFCILIVSKKYHNGIKYLCPILLILSDVIIYMSGERTSFGILLMINFAFLILISQMKIIRLVTFVISLSIIFLISLNSSIVKNRMIDQTINDLGIKGNKIHLFSNIHQDHYETAYKMFKKNSISGVGVKMFRYECSKKVYESGKYSCTTHPHHLHLQILSETGLIGYMFVLFVLIFIIRKFIITIYANYFKNNLDKNLDLQNCILIGVFVNIFPFLPSGNFFNNWLSIIYFLPIGFYSLKNFKYGN